MKITIKDAREVHACCTILTTGTKTVITKLANGSDASAQVNYELEDKAWWNATKNFETTDRAVKDADKRREHVTKDMEARNGGKTVSKKGAPELFAEWESRTKVIEESVVELPLLRISRKGLKEAPGNPIPPFVVTTLLSIVNAKGVALLDDDLPATEAADVLSDDVEPAKPAEKKKK